MSGLRVRVKAKNNIFIGGLVTTRRRDRSSNQSLRNERKRADEKRRPSGKFNTKKSKLFIIKEEFSKCIGVILERCDLTIPEKKLESLEKSFSVAIAEATLPEHTHNTFDPATDGRGGIVQFLERAWFDPWIASGVFTRSYFRRVDHRGEMALQNFLRNPQNALPFEVPTKSQEWDRKLNDAEQSRSAWRAVAAAARRRAKAAGGESPKNETSNTQ